MSLNFEPRSVRLFWSRLGSAIIGALLVFAFWFSFFPRPENVMPSEINLSVEPSTQAWIKTLPKNEAGQVLLPKGTLLSCQSDLKNEHCKTAAILAPPSKQSVSSENLREFIPAHQLARETYTTCMEKRFAVDGKGCILLVQQLAEASAKHRNQPDFPQRVNAAMIDMGLLEKSQLR